MTDANTNTEFFNRNQRSIREEKVMNAVSFLMHPNIVDSQKQRKVDFLKSKGLTDEEIDEAFSRAEFQLSNSKALVPSSPSSHSSSLFTSIPFILTVVASVSLIGYGLVYSIKRFLIPLLTKSKRKRKHEKKRRRREQEDRIERLLTEILQEQETAKSKLNQLQENVSESVIPVSSISPTAVSIPEWQRNSPDSLSSLPDYHRAMSPPPPVVFAAQQYPPIESIPTHGLQVPKNDRKHLSLLDGTSSLEYDDDDDDTDDTEDSLENSHQQNSF